jgi:hypothetical protein
MEQQRSKETGRYTIVIGCSDGDNPKLLLKVILSALTIHFVI